jgi:hypothetical protein
VQGEVLSLFPELAKNPASYEVRFHVAALLVV